MKQSMVQILHSNWQFTGLSHEDPTVHIQNFLEISDTYNPTGVNKNYVRLTLLPFSLLGEANRWLNSELAISITTWDDLSHKFIIRFFPSGKTAKLRSDILNFRQKGGKNLYQILLTVQSLRPRYFQIKLQVDKHSRRLMQSCTPC